MLQLIRKICNINSECKSHLLISNCWIKILDCLSSTEIKLDLQREGTLLLFDLSKMAGFSEIDDSKMVYILYIIKILFFTIVQKNY